MDSFVALFKAIDQRNDALAEHRHAIVRSLCLLGGLMLLGITSIHLFNRNWPLVAMNGTVVALLLLTNWSMRHGASSRLPLPVMAVLLVLAVLASVHLQGMVGVLWSFPLIFVAYFALPRYVATLLTAVLVTGVAVLAWPVLGTGLMLRVLLSQVFVVLMINIVLSLLGELQQALLAQAVTDPLTGAYNRRHLQTRLDELVRPGPAPATPGPGNALLALDVDHFKDINDGHGHDVGDEVLRRLVAVLNSRKRSSDLLFRTGGEEFMLLLPRIDEAAALQMAEELRERIAASPLLPDHRVTVSIGVSVLHPGQDTRTWLKRADTALYAAKRAGRNRVMAAAA